MRNVSAFEWSGGVYLKFSRSHNHQRREWRMSPQFNSVFCPFIIAHARSVNPWRHLSHERLLFRRNRRNCLPLNHFVAEIAVANTRKFAQRKHTDTKYFSLPPLSFSLLFSLLTVLYCCFVRSLVFSFLMFCRTNFALISRATLIFPRI